MKKIIGSLVMGLAVAGSVGARADEVRTFDMKGFDAVSVSSGISVEILIGPQQLVEVEFDSKSALDRLKLNVRDNVLFVSRKSGFLDFLSFGNRDLEVLISLPQLNSVSASSGSDVQVSGNYSAVLVAKSSSGANLSLEEISARNVTLNASSGANIDAEGTCETLTAASSSGADINANDLECSDAIAKASSGADLDIFASDSITAHVSSGADIKVSGNPHTRDVNQSSGGDVKFTK